MPVTLVDPKTLYEKDPKLDREDVKALLEWCEKQPHLPNVTELEAILFLHSCYYRLEPAKVTLDNFFTVRSLVPEIYGKCDPNDPLLLEAMNGVCAATLKQKTKQNYQVLLVRLMDFNSDHYNYTYQSRVFDMVAIGEQFCKGPQDGYVLVFDLKGGTLGHLAKVNMSIMRKTFYFIQEAIPLRLKGIHLINPVSFMDTLLSILKPILKRELLDILCIHLKIDELYKYVPKEILPKDYGGNDDSLEQLQAETNKFILENIDLFNKILTEQKVDESKRPGKPKDEGQLFGMEGSFKKLDID